MRRDFENADRVLPTIPKEHRTRVAHFLEKQGFKPQALQVSTDPDHRFDLALQIGDLDVALTLAREADNPQKWSQLADVATSKNNIELVKECLEKANDFGGLLLLATSAGDHNMLKGLSETCTKQGRHNISFLSTFLLGDLHGCLQILIATNRLPEAAFFARTYIPSQITHVVDLWRAELAKVNEKAGQSLADPDKYENLFPGLQDALKVEQFLQKEKHLLPATSAPSIPLNSERNPLAEMIESEENGTFEYHTNVDSSSLPPSTTETTTKPKEITHPPIGDHKKNDEDFLEGLSAQNPYVTSVEAAILDAVATNNSIDLEKREDERKSSLDDFDLEIDGITLDDNLDTTVSGIIKIKLFTLVYILLISGC